MTDRLLRHLSISLLTVLSLAAASAPAAGEPGWIPLGPQAGQGVGSLAVLPGAPGRIAAAGTSGVFGTDDGQRWELLDGEGLPFGTTGWLESTPVPGGSFFLVTRGGRTVHYLPGGTPGSGASPGEIFRSSDRGASWQVVRETSGVLATSILEPSTLYLATEQGIEVSRDGGDTWAPVTPDPFDLLVPPGALSIVVAGLEMAPSDPDVVSVLVVLDDEKGFPDRVVILRSRNAGASWEAIEGPEIPRIPGAESVSGSDLMIDPSDPDTIYVALSRGVFRSVDGGATWELRSEGLPFSTGNSGTLTTYPVEEILADPEQPEILYAATRRSDQTPGGVYRSTDAGASWAPASDGLPLPTTVHDLAFGPGDTDTLYAATPDGAFRSTDRGVHWSPTTGNLPTPAGLVAVDPSTPATQYTGAGGRLYRSDDGGLRWRRIGQELPQNGRVNVFSVAPSDPSVLFTHVGDGTIGRSTDGGSTWTTLPSPLRPFADVVELSIDPRDSHRLLAAVRELGGVFLSTDRGETWSMLLEGRIEGLVRAPSDPDVLYASAPIGSAGQPIEGVCRSDDEGSSWQCSETGLTDGRGVTALAVDPRDSSRALAALLVGGLNQKPAEARLRRTIDGGATWEPVEPGLPLDGTGVVTDLVIDPRNPEIVWAASTRGGVFRSTDGGSSWTPVNGGLTHLGVEDLEIDPSGRVILAATGSGVFRFSESAGPPPPTEIDWIEEAPRPGFRVKARIGQGGRTSIAATREPACIPETVCLSGALPGRSELFVRIVGPKPNGYLWPTLVKFSTSRIEIWIQQRSTGEIRYYDLRGAEPGFDRLPGLFDRLGFLPD